MEQLEYDEDVELDEICEECEGPLIVGCIVGGLFGVFVGIIVGVILCKALL